MVVAFIISLRDDGVFSSLALYGLEHPRLPRSKPGSGSANHLVIMVIRA